MAITISNDILKYRESTSDNWKGLLMQPAGGCLYFTNQTVSVATSSEIFRITDSSITTQTIVISCNFVGDVRGVSWTSYDGYIAFYGTCAVATTADVIITNVSTPSTSVPLSIANGGTGSNNAADAIANLGASAFPTWVYVEEETTSSSTDVTWPSTPYTIHGNGFIIATVYVRTDTTNDTGTAIAAVSHRPISEGINYYRGFSMYRLQTAQAMEIGTEATGCFIASDGDTLCFRAECTKNGTKRIRYSILAFGCTLS